MFEPVTQRKTKRGALPVHYTFKLPTKAAIEFRVACEMYNMTQQDLLRQMVEYCLREMAPSSVPASSADAGPLGVNR